ncbi:MAG: hypothetical protein EYC70_13730 [Planctomycetota bacterium]|nr:MAG: hypothetical protein EYC70_13730 [Planctomycetota bacterium]
MNALLVLVLTMDTTQVAREWVVKDVLPPSPVMSGTELLFFDGTVTGDVDADERCETIVYGWSVTQGVSFEATHLGLLTDSANHVWWSQASASTKLYIESPPVSPRYALTRSALGTLLAIGSGSYNYSLTTWDLLTPYQPVAVSPAQAPLGFTRGDDLNGDGYEEIFFQDYTGAYRTAGLMDGRTLTVMWQHSEFSESGAAMVLRQDPGLLPDLNGDQVPDFIALWPLYDPTLPGFWEHDIWALSGLDGSFLWRNRENSGGGQRWGPVGGQDVNYDGVADFALTNVGLLKAVDGASGLNLWAFDPRITFAGLAPPGTVYWAMLEPAVLNRSAVAAPLELCGVIQFFHTATQTYEEALVHVDAGTGAFLEQVPLPHDLEPWFPDPMQEPLSGSYGFALGDADRDGLKEIGWRAPAYTYDHSTFWAPPTHLVTLGLRTLRVPRDVRVGAAIVFDVAIPSAPDHEFFVLVSRRFDRRGFLVNRWETHLGVDQWLDWSYRTRALSGRLDALGAGSVAWTLPANPALAGQTVYSKAVVLQPGTVDRVWTLSTLGITAITP